MRYGSEHKQKTRDRVLKVAAKEIRAEGPHRVGVAGVMSKAGLTHGGFYAHFASKDALISAAIERMFDDARARWRHETEGKPAADAMRAYIDFYLCAKHRDAPSVGCPIAALAADQPRLTTACRNAFATGVRGLADAIESRLVELDLVDAHALASSVQSELVGALSLARGETDRARSDAMLEASRRLLKQRLGL